MADRSAVEWRYWTDAPDGSRCWRWRMTEAREFSAEIHHGARGWRPLNKVERAAFVVRLVDAGVLVQTDAGVCEVNDA